MAEAEADTLPQIEAILVKKNEGRPVTPEEYSILAQFVDRVERAVINIQQAERMAEMEVIAEVQEQIAESAFEMPVEELGFTERITGLLVEGGYESVGDLIVQMELDSDEILALNGIGPKAMENIEQALTEVSFPEPEVEEIEEEVQAVEEEQAEAVAETEQPEEAVVEDEPVEAEAELVEAAEEIAAPEVEEVETAEAEEETAEADEPEEEEETSFEEIFALEPDAFDIELAEAEFEEDEELDEEARKKKKKKKQKYVEMEYDPDQDVVIVKRKRKRDEDDWEEDWDF
jgi:hypothetical protein